MTDSVKFGKIFKVFALAATVAVLAGCSTSRPAPVRDGVPGPAAVESAPGGKQEGTHVVRPGDTLLGIARQYGVTVRDLTGWNNLTNPNQISVGQVLRVSAAAPAAQAPAGVVVQPVSPSPVEVQPVRPADEAPASAPATSAGVKQEPKGGKQPYSDQLWSQMKPKSASSNGAPAPALPPAQGDSAGGATSWLWPAHGEVIETFDEGSSKGVAISGKPGDPVIASAAGKVVYSGSGLRGYGKLVIIKHDANYLTAYAHNQQLLVKEGDSVSKGQKIAELGSTDAERPKLHFEIRKQGKPVDPLKYLPPR